MYKLPTVSCLSYASVGDEPPEAFSTRVVRESVSTCVHGHVHYVRKKETKIFFYNISYKAQAILMKFGT